MKVLSLLYPDRTARVVALFLLTLIVTLVLCHVGASALNESYHTEGTEILRDFFGLEREGNVPTWFSSLQLALIGVVCGVTFLAEKASGSMRKYALFWLGLSLLFLFLSMDETAQFHERLDEVVGLLSKTADGATVNQGTKESPIFFYLLLYVPGLGAVSAALIGFVFRRVKDRATRVLFVAGLIGFALKLGLDMLTPWAMKTVWFGHRIAAPAVILEMSVLLLGEMLILTSLFNYLIALIHKLSLRSSVRPEFEASYAFGDD